MINYSPRHMDDQQLWNTLTGVFRSVFNRDTITINEKTTAPDIPEWDSLNHVRLILAIEEAFGVRFRHAEVAAFENAGDIAQAIRRQRP